MRVEPRGFFIPGPTEEEGSAPIAIDHETPFKQKPPQNIGSNLSTRLRIESSCKREIAAQGGAGILEAHECFQNRAAQRAVLLGAMGEGPFRPNQLAPGRAALDLLYEGFDLGGDGGVQRVRLERGLFRRVVVTGLV